MKTVSHDRKELTKTLKAGFSLIELMIVVVILGALTAIIIPQFNQSEAEAKDVGCDASNYGTLRQIANYRSINGVYPSRMHTGYEVVDGTQTMGETDGVSALAKVTEENMKNSTAPVELDAKTAQSLKDAGIVKLAYGGFGATVAFEDVEAGLKVPALTANWDEVEGTTTTIADEDAVTVNGVKLYDYVNTDPFEEFDATKNPENGFVMPLFAAPTADFENYYLGGTDAKFTSKIGIAQVGGCPWLEAGSQFRYYICFFKVYDDGTPAKLIGTACPECGPIAP